ncbi:MAG: CTP synthetase [Alkalilacustris sp.]
MTRLALVLFSILSVTCMGIAVVVALVAGWDTLVPIVVAAGVGLVASVPASWIVARQIADA